jgi:hypothetical protein
MNMPETRKSISMLAVVVTITAVVLAGCDSAGAGAGGGGGTSGGSYDITFEVTGNYAPATGHNAGTIYNYNLLVTYSIAEPDGSQTTEQFYDPALTFSKTYSLAAGTAVDLDAILLDSGGVTYSIKQNGSVVESSSDTSVDLLLHSVGQ